ncbi:hypothetical protein M5K25_027252 [Dendrobium thyrsiflorum]|uniref:Uncharacterized protein n=1 Tax=Dendrobium thyrsiflorum TaxID=117978 RepID=A0ABD0TZD8_DENTH
MRRRTRPRILLRYPTAKWRLGSCGLFSMRETRRELQCGRRREACKFMRLNTNFISLCSNSYPHEQ